MNIDKITSGKTLQVTPYVPPVFRYLERRFVDAFFNSGELQLSTLLKCRQHPDEHRGDIHEGCGVIDFHINKASACMEIQGGLESYMLCTSLVYSDQLYEDFKCTSCIEIKDPLCFAIRVARKLHEVDSVLFGPCQYMPNRNIDRHSESSKVCQNDSDYRDLFCNVSSGVDADVQFRKHNDFRYQHEYRFLWAMENITTPLETPIVIEVPEAVNLCTRRDRMWSAYI